MTLRIGTSVRNAMAAAVSATVDGGSGAAKIRVYSGSQPANPAATATGTLLLEMPMNDPSFGSPSTGVITAVVSPAVTDDGIADGTAGWFRVLDSNNVALIDGAVTATGGGGELTLSTVTITTGLTVTLTSLTITQPAN